MGVWTYPRPDRGTRIVGVSHTLVWGRRAIAHVLALCLAFAPAGCGQKQDRVSNRDETGTGTGGITATTYAYPLAASPDGRYLVDQDGTPFFMIGDSAQSAIVNLTYSEAQAYLNDRAGKGFNTVNINLIEHKFGHEGKGHNL